jgi:hypothetical protein
MSDIQEPKIFAQESRRGTTDIVIRLPVSSSDAFLQVQKQLANFGLTLPKAFEDVLWQKLKTRKSSNWAELVGLVSEVYRQAWLQWFRLQYLGHFHPQAETIFKELVKEIESASKTLHRGRRPTVQAELASLKKRYSQLLIKCRLIRRAATHAATSHVANNAEVARKKTRLAIWEAVRPQIHGMPEDGYIFGGDAFERIPNGKAKLHDPTSWKPHQLAISILTFERMQAYQTIEKKIVPTKFGS